jgi:phosphatidate cytidylyltransferase
MADERDETSEEGAVQASDEDRPARTSGDTEQSEGVKLVGDEGPALRFGPDDTGPLPHWTEPPTGEVPSVLADEGHEDVDPWSSFSGQGPVWRDDESEDTDAGLDLTPLTGDLPPVDPDSAGLFESGEPSLPVERRLGGEAAAAAAAEQTRVTPIRTRGPNPTRSRPDTAGAASRSNAGNRDLPMAVAVGFGLAAVFILLLTLGEKYVVGLVVVLLAVAAVEFYDTVRSKGYQPAQFIGLAAVIGLPLGAYWVGAEALALILVLAFMATAVWGMASGSIDSGPLPNAAITTLGVVYVGLLGAYASLILRLPNNWGKGVLFATVAGVVLNDIGAFFVGSSAGRTPVAAWISPKKTVEGLVGGAFLTFIALAVVKIMGVDPWQQGSWGKLLLFALVIVIVTPLGDFTESMFKRNLDVKDFGTLLPGHGGILDRFDGMLFALPAAYYAALIIEPWVK